jgi:ATP-dependent protease ClpP protease subunit
MYSLHTSSNNNKRRRRCEDVMEEDEVDDDIVECLDSSTVYFGAEISKKTVFELRKCLYKLRRGGVSCITIVINSAGGDAHEGFAAYDIIRAMCKSGTTIITRVEGMACSAATIMLLAGKTREITENSHFLIHQVSSLMCGKRNDLHDELGNIEKITNQMMAIYERHSKMKRRTLQEHLNQELSMTADETLKHGFVDAITKEI